MAYNQGQGRIEHWRTGLFRGYVRIIYHPDKNHQWSIWWWLLATSCSVLFFLSLFIMNSRVPFSFKYWWLNCQDHLRGLYITIKQSLLFPGNVDSLECLLLKILYYLVLGLRIQHRAWPWEGRDLRPGGRGCSSVCTEHFRISPRPRELESPVSSSH